MPKLSRHYNLESCKALCGISKIPKYEGIEICCEFKCKRLKSFANFILIDWAQFTQSTRNAGKKLKPKHFLKYAPNTLIASCAIKPKLRK